MQFCGQILKDSSETFKTIKRSVNSEFERKVDVQNRTFGWIRFQNCFFIIIKCRRQKCKPNSPVN